MLACRSVGNWKRVAFGGPPFLHVGMEVLGPHLGQRVVVKDCGNDVLVLVSVVVSQSDNVHAHGEIGQSWMLSTEPFHFVFLQMVFNFLQPGWEQLSDVSNKMLVFCILVCIKEWHSELVQFTEP